jgi:TDG/mug DNA glycosylase family protein
LKPVLPDLLIPDLRLVVCGSAAGTVSARRGAYYAGPGNKFWRILAETGLTPRLLRPEEFPLLPGFGIGLTDLAKHAFGPDIAIRLDHYDPEGLLIRVCACRPGVLAFNGKRAASVFLGVKSSGLAYGVQPAVSGLPTIFVLPSTSGLASRKWDASHWHDLAAIVRHRPGMLANQ